MKWFLLIVLASIISLASLSCEVIDSEQSVDLPKIENTPEDSIVKTPPEFIASKFAFPVGDRSGSGYYNAQGFGKNNHLGDDWNALTGGNSDLGEPIYAIASGYVCFAKDLGGSWGIVLRIIHTLPSGEKVESLYAHCDEFNVKVGDWVKLRDQIGTIGTANGKYYAHLHHEIRDIIEMPIGGGYSSKTSGYLDPSEFIRTH
jgi:murein DD-endopeptidase MepM/ murein hydrolase activator NlpD